ncbi:MAG: hypothetical protein ACREI5_03520, partial [Candidatus Methylomirabilales bacterium]
MTRRNGVWVAAALGLLAALTSCAPAQQASSTRSYEVWVTNQSENKVQILDGQSVKVIAEIPVASKPHNVTFSPDFKTAYIASVGSNDFTVIDAV